MHVWAEEGRFAVRRRLEHIVPTNWHQAAADENHRPHRIEPCQLPDSIEEEDGSLNGVRG